MDVKVLFRKSRKFYALILLLLIFTVPVALSGCGGGGGGGSSSGASASVNPNGTVSTSQTYNISGTVAGGSGNLSGVTVALYILNTSNGSFSSTGDTATTGSNGSYSLTYSGSGLDYFLVVVVTPSGNTLYNIAFGSLGIPNITMDINELTTAQAVYAFQQAGGTMTSSGSGIPLGAISNYTALYNDLPASPSNTYTIGFSNSSVNSNSLSSAASEIETLADALASCVQSTSYCSSVKGNLPNYTSGDGMFIYILIGNYTNASMQTALNNLLSAISSLGIPWTSPAAVSSSSTSTTTSATGSGGTSTPISTTTLFTVGSDPEGVAVDSNGNIWVANKGNGTVGTVSGDSNVMELNSSGDVIGTYAAGVEPDSIAIDSSDNVWVTNLDSSTVTELSPNGTIIGTYTVGNGPDAIAIDSSGNVWVANYYGDSVTELSPNGTNIGTYAAGTNPDAIAIDSFGNVWVANSGNDTAGAAQGDSNVMELNSAGVLVGTYVVGIDPNSIAIDSSGDVWVANYGVSNSYGTGLVGNSVSELQKSSSGYVVVSYSLNIYPYCMAVDGSGNIWIGGWDGQIRELNGSTGAIIKSYSVIENISSIAIDDSGNLWVSGGSMDSTAGVLAEFTSVASGVKTPLVAQPK